MKRVWSGFIAGCVGLSLAASETTTACQPAPKPVPPQGAKEETGCGDFGTSVTFVANPSEAAKQAKKDQKLAFVLHVSGHFEEPQFT